MLHKVLNFCNFCICARFCQGICGLGEAQPPFGFIQLIAKVSLLFVGKATVNYSDSHDFAAIIHFTHGGNPVLTVNHIKFSVTEADDHRIKQAFIPVPD